MLDQSGLAALLAGSLLVLSETLALLLEDLGFFN